jgi:putative two-component system response regulator
MSLQKQKILIVDDTPENIQILIELLKDDYKIATAKSAEKALKLANIDPQPDLILLDIVMPDIDGYELCKTLKSNPGTEHIPVIFITSMTDSEHECKGLELGALDYISKPFIPGIVKSRIKNHMELQRYKHNLENIVDMRTKKLMKIQSVLIDSLGTLAEYRDSETGGHIKRTQNYVKVLAKELQQFDKYKDFLTDEVVELLFLFAPLHDIGKIAIRDEILLKPGDYTKEEYDIMKQHSYYGYEALNKIKARLGDDNFINIAIDMAYTHHEKWDGSGYPRGLMGEEIPLVGRIMAVADVYDAIISKRVYKPPIPHKKAIEIIRGLKSTQFDPEIVDIFIEKESVFKNIAINYADFDEEVENMNPGIKNSFNIILLVEDNEINLMIMKSQLENLGYIVHTALNGQQALEMFHENSYDLILTDIEMPILNGFELVNKIRKSGSSIPIVAITASDYELNNSNIIEKGFNGFALKPFDEKKIKYVINHINI